MPSVEVDKRSRFSKRMWFIVVVCAFVVIVFPAILNRYALVRFAVRSLGLHLEPGYAVHYVVPNGYRGVFSISEDPMNGVPPSFGEHGEFVYSIPKSGHLVTTDATPMVILHKTKATYRSGKPIEVEGDSTEIKFRELGVGSTGPSREMIFEQLIGIDQEVNDWWADRKVWFRIEKSDEKRSDVNDHVTRVLSRTGTPFARDFGFRSWRYEEQDERESSGLLTVYGSWAS